MRQNDEFKFFYSTVRYKNCILEILSSQKVHKLKHVVDIPLTVSGVAYHIRTRTTHHPFWEKPRNIWRANICFAQTTPLTFLTLSTPNFECCCVKQSHLDFATISRMKRRYMELGLCYYSLRLFGELKTTLATCWADLTVTYDGRLSSSSVYSQSLGQTFASANNAHDLPSYQSLSLTGDSESDLEIITP